MMMKMTSSNTKVTPYFQFGGFFIVIIFYSAGGSGIHRSLKRVSSKGDKRKKGTTGEEYRAKACKTFLRYYSSIC